MAIGTFTMPKGGRSYEVTVGISATDLIHVVASQNPGKLATKFYSVKQVIKDTGKFTVELFSPVEQDTIFDYYYAARTGVFTGLSGHESVEVSQALSVGQMVLVTPTSSPAQGVAGDYSVKYISYDFTNSKFTVYFNNVLQNDTSFDYKVVTLNNSGTFENGREKDFVSNVSVTPSSHLAFTFKSDPGKDSQKGFSVKYLNKVNGSGAYVYFNNTLNNATAYDYVFLT